MIRDENDSAKHIDYIHYNRVKRGHVKNAVDGQYSTIHQYIEHGWLDENWGNFYQESELEIFGEPVGWASQALPDLHATRRPIKYAVNYNT